MNHYIDYDGRIFTSDKIMSGNIYLAASLLSSSLEVNSFFAEVECEDPSILNFQRNTKLLYYAESGRPMVFRVQSVERVAPKLYDISATSTLGLLAEGQHYGGIYAGETAEEVVASICGTVPFEIKSNLRGVKLYGWLPIAAPRDNLAQVLFVIGAALKTDLDGVLRIEGLWDGVSRSVGADRMYQASSVKYESAVTSVVVTEHQYIRGSEEKSLYEGTALEGDIITFSEPMHSLTADGFRILDLGANWAKLSAGTGVLRGSAYVHNTREVVKPVLDGQEPNVKTVTDATLVSLVNSESVANRLKNFYQWRETIDAPIVYHGEQPGDRMEIYHPFDKNGVVSCLQSADISLSNTLKAQGKSLVGFAPEQIEDIETYDYREVLTGSGEWEPPEGTSEVTAVLIGAGGGGHNGQAAQPYTYVSVGSNTTSGSLTINIDGLSVGESTSQSASNSHSATGCSASKGGAGGAGGAAGKVYRVNVPVEAGKKIRYFCGNGGAPNEQGEETIFGEETSESGGTMPAGYVDAVTGEIFAAPGAAGMNGGDGGSAGSNGGSADGVPGGEGTSSPATDYPGAPLGIRIGYNAGSGYGFAFVGYATLDATLNFGGAGGGGAGGSSGDNRGSAGTSGSSISITKDTSIYPWRVTAAIAGRGIGGAGARGADGSSYGSGGNGGGGAGGNGAVGNVSLTAKLEINGHKAHDIGTSDDATYRVQARITNGTSSALSPGGAGGFGAPGCVILYYGAKKVKQSGQFVDRNGKSILDEHLRRLVV